MSIQFSENEVGGSRMARAEENQPELLIEMESRSTNHIFKKLIKFYTVISMMSKPESHY